MTAPLAVGGGPTASASLRAAPGDGAGQSRPAAVMRVALAGCGAVGSALVRLLQERAAAGRNVAPRIELVRVLVRDPGRERPVTLGGALVTDDIDDFLATPADVVVEAIGGLKLPRRLAWDVLSAGRHYVTANKALLADCGPELAEIAAHRGAAFDFGAAVAAGLPVVRLLRDTAAGVGIHALRGILNGTTNYLLGRLATGISYDAALAEAQAHGFADSDPRGAVSGQDSADKIALLAWLAFGCHPRKLVVRTRGLSADTADLSAIAAAVGGVVKLIAEAVETSDGLVAAVEPMLVATHSTLGSVDGEQNLVEIESRSAGTIGLQGRGTGGMTTASTLYADLLRGATPVHLPAIRRPAPTDPRKLRWLLLLPQEGTALLDGYCRTNSIAWEEVLSTARPRARSIVALHCPPTALAALVERLDETDLQPKWVRAAD